MWSVQDTNVDGSDFWDGVCPSVLCADGRLPSAVFIKFLQAQSDVQLRQTCTHRLAYQPLGCTYAVRNGVPAYTCS
jgi:hypothetical protein